MPWWMQLISRITTPKTVWQNLLRLKKCEHIESTSKRPKIEHFVGVDFGSFRSTCNIFVFFHLKRFFPNSLQSVVKRCTGRRCSSGQSFRSCSNSPGSMHSRQHDKRTQNIRTIYTTFLQNVKKQSDVRRSGNSEPTFAYAIASTRDWCGEKTAD